MTKFVKVRVWSWTRFFTGTVSMTTDLNVTEEKVRKHIENSTHLGGSGNYDSDSLSSTVIEVKASKANIVDIP